MPDWLVHDSLAPSTKGALAALYVATASGALALPYCGACEQPVELDQLRCDACGSGEIVWRRVDLRGTVHSATTVHRREPGLILSTAPYHVIDVELTSGHRLLMTTESPAAESPAIGAPVDIVFRHIGGVAVPAVAVTTKPDATDGDDDHQEVAL